MRKLFYVLSTIVPYTPNINKLAKQIGSTRDTLLKYLSYLHLAHVFIWLSKDTMGISFLNKPEKLFLDNNNIAFAFSQNVNVGTVREVFFLNQIKNNHKVAYANKGDFFVDGKYTFEIGGKNKKRKQIDGLENAFIVVDDIELTVGEKIPLWLFGFLY